MVAPGLCGRCIGRRGTGVRWAYSCRLVVRGLCSLRLPHSCRAIVGRPCSRCLVAGGFFAGRGMIWVCAAGWFRRRRGGYRRCAVLCSGMMTLVYPILYCASSTRCLYIMAMVRTMHYCACGRWRYLTLVLICLSHAGDRQRERECGDDGLDMFHCLFFGCEKRAAIA